MGAYMIKIVINGTTADLKGASKQELVFQNPILDYEAMLGEYGLPFSLPFSPINDRIFSNARSEFSPTMALTYLCEQYLNDDLIAEGLIVLKDTNAAYNCNFTSNLRDIFTPVSGSVRYDGYLRDILPAGPSVSPVANRNAMTTWNGIVCYPLILNDKFYTANAPGGWNNYVNSYASGTYQNTTFVPCVSVKYLLNQIGTYYGITFQGDFMTEPNWVSRLVILHNQAEDGATTAQLKFAVGDLKVAEFVNQIRVIFGLTGDIDLIGKTIKLDWAKKYFDAPVDFNFSDICSKIISKVASPYSGLELGYNADIDDKALELQINYQNYLSPGVLAPLKRREIKSNFSVINQQASPRIPLFSQAGKTTVNNQINTKVLPRIGFYRGKTNISPLGDIPFMTYDYYTSLRSIDRLTTTEGFAFNSEEAFWQNTFEASFQINLRKLSLSSFDIKSKVHIHGWNYLIKRIVMDCNNPEKSLLEAYRA